MLDARLPAISRTALLAAFAALAWLPATTMAQQPDAEDPTAAFSWLEGEWHREIRGGVAIERWRRVEGIGLVGEMTRVSDGGATERHTEALLLVTMGADTFYIPRPAENPYPVAFRLVSLTDDTAVFENPTHDFPQRIIYRRDSADAMTVSIEGPGDDGDVQRIDFVFVRGG